jgi:outer membrane biosynthesis protein TonB
MSSPREQEIRARVDELQAKLDGLAEDLRVVDEEIEALAPERQQLALLTEACDSLEKLGEIGAAALFWGEEVEQATIAGRLRDARGRVSGFEQRLGELEQRRRAIDAEMAEDARCLEELGEDLYDIRQEEERRKLEWIVEREASELPPRRQVMAWARGGEDDRRFYRTLAGSLLSALLLGALLPMIELPLPKLFEPDAATSKRLAQLVREAQARPVPPPRVTPEAPPEEPEPVEEPVEEPEPVEKPDPVTPETQAVADAGPEPADRPGPNVPDAPVVPDVPPRKAVEKAGLLAFKDKFASLAKDDREPRLGADARFGDADEVSKASMTTRSMLTTNAPGSSGGINIAGLSRNVAGGGNGNGDGDGGGGGGIHGVEVGRATSAITAVGGEGGGRPRARGGPGASRTDEEIQIVFDRYKAALYRLYNRGLRRDPTLRGQMVLRLTIEPDGSVSMCELHSSDMDAPELARQVVERVRTINFGAKEVQALTIVYPIDFLPAA